MPGKIIKCNEVESLYVSAKINTFAMREKEKTLDKLFYNLAPASNHHFYF